MTEEDRPSEGLARLPEPEPKQPVLPLEGFEKLLELERLRLEAANRRTKLGERALELADASDQRQFEYASQGMKNRFEERRESRRRSFQLLCSVLVGVGLVGGFLLWMLFWGTEPQKQMAWEMFSHIASAVSGAGGAVLFARMLRRQPAENE